jgi:sucrose-6F-phosphate phosphohydrolase
MDPGRVVVADLDGTLVGDAAALERFAGWHAANRRGHRLVYATGRLWDSIEQLMAETALPVPDAVIAAVGTEIRDGSGHHWPGWADRMHDFDADAIRAALRRLDWLSPQSEAAQTRLKASYDIVGLTESQEAEILETLARAGMVGKIVYSAGLHLDVVPPEAGKGIATSFLTDSWGVPRDAVMVFGDTGNDADLFQHGFRGTVVSNALQELIDVIGQGVYRSAMPFADGVLDGIRHWSRGDDRARSINRAGRPSPTR